MAGMTLRSTLAPLLASSLLLLVACGDDTEGSGGAGGTTGDGPTTSAGPTGSGGGATAASGTGGAGGAGGGSPLESYSITWGPLEVPAGIDHTQCVTKRLGNPSELQVGSIRNVLSGVSHHLIVYKVADEEERPEPYDCDPFQDTLDPSKGMPLMITQKAEETLELPEGVAFTLEPDQMIRLEMHYVNPGVEPATIEATSTMIAIAPGAFEHEAGFLFAGSADVEVPGNAATTLGPVLIDMPPELEGKNFFAFTGHVHKLGTNVTVDMTDGDGRVPVYDVEGFEWSEPPTQTHDPAVVLGEDEGFEITCAWNNTTPDDVGFGEQASDEMCFFWAYYYPSEGSRVCAHTDRIEGGFDLCCPGSPFCDQVFGD
jgi:hypothetical protein